MVCTVQAGWQRPRRRARGAPLLAIPRTRAGRRRARHLYSCSLRCVVIINLWS